MEELCTPLWEDFPYSDCLHRWMSLLAAPPPTSPPEWVITAVLAEPRMIGALVQGIFYGSNRSTPPFDQKLVRAESLTYPAPGYRSLIYPAPFSAMPHYSDQSINIETKDSFLNVSLIILINQKITMNINIKLKFIN